MTKSELYQISSNARYVIALYNEGKGVREVAEELTLTQAYVRATLVDYADLIESGRETSLGFGSKREPYYKEEIPKIPTYHVTMLHGDELEIYLSLEPWDGLKLQYTNTPLTYAFVDSE